MTAVLDASAVLAYFNNEPGQDRVSTALDDAVISTANWAEVLQKLTAAGGDADRLGDGLVALGLRVEPLTIDDARMIARLWHSTRSAGLSLGDRACLALAHRTAAPALTADTAWATIADDVGVTVKLIRNSGA